MRTFTDHGACENVCVNMTWFTVILATNFLLLRLIIWILYRL